MESQPHMGAEFHRCSIQDNNMADIKSNKKSFMSLRKYFREYCDYTGIHGLKYIGEKRSLCEKISWTLIFCLSLFTCITVVYEVFKKWQKSPIIINFASEQLNIYDVTFPAVTICPETKVLSDYFNYSYSLKLSKNDTIPDDQLKKLQYMSLLCNVNYHYFKIERIDTIDEGFYDFLKNGVPPFLTKCSWMGTDYPCEQIFQPLITDEGLCVTFNMLSKKEMYTSAVETIPDPPSSYEDLSGHHWSADHGYAADAGIDTYPRRALLSGSTNALEVNFAINNTDLDYGCTHYQGYKVVLHSPHRFPIVHTHYFRIPLKKSVSAAITPGMLSTSDDVKQYSSKKRKCFFQTDKQLAYFSNYSQLNCRSECLLNLTLATCGCVEFFMPRDKSMPICGTAKHECVKNVSDKQAILLLKKHLNEYLILNNKKHHHENQYENRKKIKGLADTLTSRYFCNCPDMCNNMDYNVEITESDYDWPRKMAALDIDVVAEDVEGMSTSQLQVYFKTNTFVPQERNEVYGTFDFLANVGGLLGLFIGFSLLSMIELMYFLSLRIICNINLYKAWYGKPAEYKPKNPMIEAVTVIK